MGFRSMAAVAAAALNQLSSSSSSTITSSVSSSNLPPLGNTSSSYGNSWSGYSPGSGMRGSASLQDFSAYRKVSVDEDDGTLGSNAGLVQTKPPTYQIQRDGAGFSSKVPKGSPVRSAPVTTARSWCRVVAVTLLMCLLVILTYCGFHWGRLYWRPEKLQYAIVLDCGSTGTRVHVYAWAYKDSSGPEQLPVVMHPASQQNLRTFPGRRSGQKKEARAYQRMETEPGFDKLLKNESGVRAAVEPLLQWAEKQIPPSAHRSTPLFLLATAGMRRLANSDAEWLLDRAWSILEGSPFMCRRSWVKVISGVEEAYYGWVALNYHLGRLGRTPQQPTLGALDLGGSSLQVTFESEEVNRSEYGLNLSVGTTEHHLYAYSHAGFGLNDAFDRSVRLLLNHTHKDNSDAATGSVEVRHPCLHTGYQKRYKCSHCLFQSSAEVPDGFRRKGVTEQVSSEIALVGEPNWEACKALAEAVVNTSMFSQSTQAVDCEEPPCALGRHQPKPYGQFYALSGFFVVYKFFSLPHNARFEELLKQGKGFCAKPWKDALESVVPQPLVEHYCFRAPYVVALLHDGLHLEEEQIVVGSGNMTWTLGAALLEAGALVPSKMRGAAPRRSGFKNLTKGPLVLDTSTLTIFLLVLLMVVLFAVTYFNQCITLLWRKPHLPLFTQPSSSSSSVWLPSIFLPPIRLGINTGVNAIRNGEGKYKTPHSPAPLGTVQDLHQQKFGSGSPLAGVGNPMLESGGLQLPTSGGSLPRQFATIKMPHKGNSQLQSRRTQSRDDLHLLYVGDNHISKV